MILKNIIFDLDGTLLNSSEGIINSVQYALEKDGRMVEDKKELEIFIGPPLKDTFTRFFEYSDEEAEERILDYRDFFAKEGFDQSSLYEGVKEMVEKLSKKANLYIATTKLDKYAHLSLEKFGIENCFQGIQGSTADGKITFKTDVLAKLVEDHKLDPEVSIMIGDHLLDINGAKDQGMRSVGVTYGFGDLEEIQQADYQVDSISELSKLLEDLLDGKN